MKARSWIHVAGDDEDGLAGAIGTGADVVVIDLSVVADDARSEARTSAASWLAAHRENVLESEEQGHWVRVGPLGDGAKWREDVLAVLPLAPHGIILPNVADPENVRQIAAELYEFEQRCGITANSTRLIPVVGQTAASALAIEAFLTEGHHRIAGFAWDGVALAEAIGATRPVDPLGRWLGAMATVRARVLLTAHAAGLVAIDMIPPGDGEGRKLERAAAASRGDGFTGMAVHNAEQVAAINAAFGGKADAGHDKPRSRKFSALLPA